MDFGASALFVWLGCWQIRVKVRCLFLDCFKFNITWYGIAMLLVCVKLLQHSFTHACHRFVHPLFITVNKCPIDSSHSVHYHLTPVWMVSWTLHVNRHSLVVFLCILLIGQVCFFVIILIVAYEHYSLLCEECENFNSNTLLILNFVTSHFTCDEFCYCKALSE